MIQDATSPTPSSTSGSSLRPSHEMPPLTTTAPGFTMSAVTIEGDPTAAITTSARRVWAAMSSTAECTTVTAALAPAPFSVSSSESGRPRVGPRPTITTSLPARSMP